MVKLTHLFNLEDLQWNLDNGFVSKQDFPDTPISILNYTQLAMFKSKWDNVTENCRGLIYDTNTLEIIARGPKKFYNWGQPQAPSPSLDTPVRVTRKEDGSLGIGYYFRHDGYTYIGIATRGIFSSEQAFYANNHLLTEQQEKDIIEAASVGATKIYEIVYPGNRIVLDYGQREELIPLGTVFNYTGTIQGRPSALHEGRMTTLHDALKLPIPADEEGYVLDILDDHGESLDHVKLKGHEYLQLHAILTNSSARRIWVELAAHHCHKMIEKDNDWAHLLKNDPEDFKRVNLKSAPLQQLMDNVPDEFYDWVVKTRDRIINSAWSLEEGACWEAEELRAKNLSRGQQYEAVRFHPMQKEILYAVRSGDFSRITIKAWQMAKPEHELPFKVFVD